MPKSGTRTFSQSERASEAAGRRPEQRFVKFDRRWKAGRPKGNCPHRRSVRWKRNQGQATDRDRAFGHRQSITGERTFHPSSLVVEQAIARRAAGEAVAESERQRYW